MKTCTECRIEKPIDQFYVGQSRCKDCCRVRDAARYREKSELYNASRKKHKQGLVAWSRSLKNGPCTDCKQIFHPVCMQWDHIGSDKVGDVATLVSNSKSKAVILAEIAKCELVCANCHAVRTFTRLQPA